MSTTYLDKSVGQLVAEMPRRAKTFERLGIDYCCGGKKLLADACARTGLDSAAVVRELSEIEREPVADDTDWLHAPVTALCDHIEQTHHAWLKENLPRLAGLAEKVVRAHGANDPRLVELRDVVGEFRLELQAHMGKEEFVLFPLIRSLDGATVLPQVHCGSVNNPIRVMMLEHDDAGEALARMRKLTDDFTPPASACNTYRALLDGLRELEADMHQHVHKENNILFPRAVEAEAGIGQAA